MPRAVDPGLFGQQLPITHSPLNRIDASATKPDWNLDAIFDQLMTFVTDFLFPAIEQLTGIDLSAFLPLLELLDLDFSSPVAFLMSLINSIVMFPQVIVELLFGLLQQLLDPSSSDMLTDLLSGLISMLVLLPTMLLQLANSLIQTGMLGIGSAINALNLFNIIPQTLLGFIPFSAIGEGNPNLLSNPSFDGAESVHGGAMWFHDAAVGRTSPGSVYCTANGQLKQLRSNPIPVSINQELAISVFSQWSGLAFTGTPIRLQVVRLLEGEDVAVDNLASPTSPGANQATWLEISNTYTVPGGCDNICLQLVVSATATAGTIRFDDGSVIKTGSSATFVPPWNVLGIGGPANIGETIFGTWNQLIAGFVGTLGGIGAGLADMFSVGQEVSSMASLGKYSWEVLGVRNNKPIDQGLLATSNSNFSLGRVAMQSSAPTIPVTQAASAMGFLRMQESNDKGVVSWLGYGTTNITGCYVNIWKMDSLTGDIELVHRSPNIVGLLSGGTSPEWVVYDYPDDMLLTHAGELYGVEITVVGAGTHTMCGATTWMPPHPSSFPKTYAATRNSGTGTPAIGTVIPGASVNYSTNIPWIEWGIVIEGDFGAHPDVITQFTEAGTGTQVIPEWANYVDVIVLGGGGPGGAGGFIGLYAYPGGAAGEWATETWERGVDFSGTTIIDITVGAGGVYGVGDGEDSVASIAGHTVTGAGGLAASSPGQYGEEAGNQDYLGLTYVGGGVSWGEGAIPGGGGTSGGDFLGGAGLNGARGGVWTVFREND